MDSSPETPTCGYCLSTLDGAVTTSCEGCGARYHTDCWQEYGGCTQFGCTDWMKRQMAGTVRPAEPASPSATSGTATPSPFAAPPSPVAPQNAPTPTVPAAPGRPPIPAAPQPVPSAVSAVPTGGWHPDPLERHQHRYWNGRKWTAMVSDAGVPSTDPYGIAPTPLVPPGGNNAAEASWYPDPSGRHQYRYWNGRRWLEKVADDGIEALDPPTVNGK